jgi:hypothetical protein
MLTGVAVATNDPSTRGLTRGTPIIVGGLVMFIVGYILVRSNSTNLDFSRGAVPETKPLLRVGKGFELTAEGLRF